MVLQAEDEWCSLRQLFFSKWTDKSKKFAVRRICNNNIIHPYFIYLCLANIAFSIYFTAELFCVICTEYRSNIKKILGSCFGSQSNNTTILKQFQVIIHIAYIVLGLNVEWKSEMFLSTATASLLHCLNIFKRWGGI